MSTSSLSSSASTSRTSSSSSSLSNSSSASASAFSSSSSPPDYDSLFSSDSPPNQPPNVVLPLLVGLSPIALTFFFGNGQAGAEFLLFLLVLFWLYFLAKVPWDLHYNYHGPQATSRKSQIDVSKVMQQMQLFTLVLAWVFPLLGGYALHQFKGVFPTYSVLMTEFNISLFVLVALVRPTQQLVKILKGQNKNRREMDFPPEDLEILYQRIEKLELEIESMREIIATQDELNGIQEAMKPALSQITELLKEIRDKEEVTKARLSKKIKGMEERLVNLGPQQSRSFYSLLIQILSSLQQKITGPFRQTQIQRNGNH